MVEGNSTNTCIRSFSFLLLDRLEPQSSKAKLILPIMPFGIVVYAFTVLWDNLCRNSCKLHIVCRLSKGYQPQPLGYVDNPYLDVDYSGYHNDVWSTFCRHPVGAIDNFGLSSYQSNTRGRVKPHFQTLTRSGVFLSDDFDVIT